MGGAADESNRLVHRGADVSVVEKSGRVLLLRAVELVVTRRGVAAIDHNFEDDIFVAMCLHPAIYQVVAELHRIGIVWVDACVKLTDSRTTTPVPPTADDAVADESKLFAT